MAVCNTIGAQIPRESDATLYTHAGPEIGVASTKAFLAQLTATYVIALALSQHRKRTGTDVSAEFGALSALPAAVDETLARMAPVREWGRELATGRAVLFLGRHTGHPIALEGALKLKELAYMHAEGFGAGELKHGPIALVEPGLPIVVVMPSPRSQPVLHQKLLSNVREVQARGARTLMITEEGDTVAREFADRVVELPVVAPLLRPFLSVIPLQILAAEIARNRGCDIDKPRNLAKSVTVE